MLALPGTQRRLRRRRLLRLVSCCCLASFVVFLAAATFCRLLSRPSCRFRSLSCSFPLFFFLFAAAEQVTTDEAAKLAEGAADEYKANIKAEAALNANKEWFSNNTEEILALASRKIQPKAEVLAVLTQAWFYLGVKKEALGDPRAPDPAAFDWSVARHKLHGSFINSILEKDPATIPTAAPAFVYQRGESIKTVLTALTPEQLAPEGSGILALQSYLVSAVDFREANAAMLKKKKEEEDERKAKEEAETKAKEEADAAAAAAAAEAAAAGGEGAPADAPAE